ncbi:HNH endonuclease, partial [Oenococcus oeni]|uniref:HNH endonuclease n=1 Tax=Oenococcus oeni TaxID=1247 RepID=UPI00117C6255
MNADDITTKDIDKFWDNVAITDSLDDCWLWKKCRDKGGYGRVVINGKSMRAHRISYILVYGYIPEDRPNVLHICDAPACCNPSHLVAGTQKDNVRHMYERNRRRHGKKLTMELAREIRQRILNGERQEGISA